MTTTAADATEWPVTTRRRMLAVAMKLFSKYSFAGTSLQMIADELGLTKAAIYYHFRTREQLVLALMEPIYREIGQVVEVAENKRGARARAAAMLAGYADVVARNRELSGVTTFDPSVRAVLLNQPEWSGLIDRQFALLGGADAGPSGQVNAAVVLTGLAGAASTTPRRVDDDTLRGQLIAAGRRTLELPATGAR